MASLPTVILYVTNLSETTTEADIRELFSRYGNVRSVRLSPGTFHLGSRGFARLVIDSDTAANATFDLDGHLLKGTVIRVSTNADATQEAQAPDQSPPGTQPIDNVIPSNLSRHQYHVESIERVTMDDRDKRGEWYRYVLANGRSRVAGLHPGTREEVMTYAENCAADFNLRNTIGKKPRVSIPTKKK
ncbi:RRM domain-containing RNA-binding protein [Thioflavicoccus mobilis 8321]|uniref:RRM domain-containing RNA-binding protein n=1 Tax=Thioflavicoccus mobilis 8321 TaxID=765912 RepID=L0GWF3_9GAMM|nr:RNA-binding protein [Thioflavicoccus mobilis]AGA90316.1 RRM domain-containing RNA-binding protein [Thioflavicoccus mobilis 8321]